MKASHSDLSRRSFLRKSGALSFGFAAMPAYLALGKEDSQGNKPPSQRINLACVGTGGKGGGDIRSHCSRKEAEPVAFCDVDPIRGGFNKWKQQYPKAQCFSDFRVMFDKMEKDIDAVTVGTPDHIHFCAVMDGMRRGKHAFCQKPLVHKFNEAELLMKAEKKWELATQMGNQGHSSTASLQFKKMVQTGVIRDILKIDAWKGPSLFFMNKGQREEYFKAIGRNKYPPAGEEVPAGLDWDLWSGPCKLRPYSRRIHPFNWRAYYGYGTGMFGDWGAHIIDFAHDYLNLGLPSRMEVIKLADHDKVLYPLATQILMHFPQRGDMPAVDMYWRDGENCQPEMEERYWDRDHNDKPKKPRLGGAGTLLYGKHGEYLVQRGSHGGGSRLYPYAKSKEFGDKMKGESPKNGGCHQAFIQACMGNGKTLSPFSVAAPLSQTLVMGTVCQYLQADLEFDRKKRQFTNNDRANEMLYGFKPRKGYEEFYEDI